MINYTGIYQLKCKPNGSFEWPHNLSFEPPKEFITTLCVDMFQGKALAIYPMDNWQTIEKQLMKLTPDKKTRIKQRLILGYAVTCTTNNNQFMIPNILQEIAELSTECYLIGMQSKLVIANQKPDATIPLYPGNRVTKSQRSCQKKTAILKSV